MPIWWIVSPSMSLCVRAGTPEPHPRTHKRGTQSCVTSVVNVDLDVASRRAQAVRLSTSEQMPWPPIRPWASKAMSLSQRPGSEDGGSYTLTSSYMTEIAGTSSSLRWTQLRGAGDFRPKNLLNSLAWTLDCFFSTIKSVPLLSKSKTCRPSGRLSVCCIPSRFPCTAPCE